MTAKMLIAKVREKLGTLSERDEQFLVDIAKILQREGAIEPDQLSQGIFIRRGVGLESGEIPVCVRKLPTANPFYQKNELNSAKQNRKIFLARKRRSRQKAKIAAIQAASRGI
jgi:hypothetical protein